MTMNVEVVRTVIAINNRCIEQINDGNFIHALSEIHEAMALLKHGVTIVDPASHISSGVGLPFSMMVSSQSSQDGSINSRQQQQSAMLTVQIKFQLDEPSTARTQNMSTLPVFSTPIVACNHLLLISTVNGIDIRSSTVEDQHQQVSVNDAVSTEDLHLLSAALLYNMGLLFHKYANTSHHNDHGISFHSTSNFRASQIYELLIQLCSHGNIWNATSDTHNGCQQHRCYLRMIQMMAYNNYAKICYKLGNYLTYQHCMNALQYQLMYLSTVGSNFHNENTEPGELELINDLRLNAFVANLFPIPILASAA